MEAIDDDRPDLGRVLALFVTETRTHVEGLVTIVSGGPMQETHEQLRYFARLHLACERAGRARVLALAFYISDDFRFSVEEGLSIRAR